MQKLYRGGTPVKDKGQKQDWTMQPGEHDADPIVFISSNNSGAQIIHSRHSLLGSTGQALGGVFPERRSTLAWKLEQTLRKLIAEGCQEAMPLPPGKRIFLSISGSATPSSQPVFVCGSSGIGLPPHAAWGSVPKILAK